MKLHPDGTVERTDAWREGKWVDLWSVVHLLSGMSIAFTLYLLEFDGMAAAVIAFLLMVAYELWEAMVKIKETRTNRVMDVVVGMASFLPAFFFVAPTFSLEPLIVVFAGVLTLNIVLSIFGWMASRKAAVLEQQLRLRYQAERERVLERFARLRKTPKE